MFLLLSASTDLILCWGLPRKALEEGVRVGVWRLPLWSVGPVKMMVDTAELIASFRTGESSLVGRADPWINWLVEYTEYWLRCDTSSFGVKHLGGGAGSHPFGKGI